MTILREEVRIVRLKIAIKKKVKDYFFSVAETSKDISHVFKLKCLSINYNLCLF